MKQGDKLVNRATGHTVEVFSDLGRNTFVSTGGTIYIKDDFSAPRDAIVAVLENGHPIPSRKPYVHANAGAAEVEARRLSELYPGNRFAVYELVSVSSAPKPIATTRAA